MGVYKGLILEIIKQYMKRLEVEQFLPISLEKAWDFSLLPKTWTEITPPEMTFKILYDIPEKCMKAWW